MRGTWTTGPVVVACLWFTLLGDARAQADDGSERGGSKTMRTAGFSLVFVGIASVSMGVVYGLEARSHADNLENVENQWDTVLDDDVDTMERFERNQFLAIGAGVVAIAAGGYLVHLGRERPARRKSKKTVDITPTITGDGGGILVQGRF